jgi:hypothetical protein
MQPWQTKTLELEVSVLGQFDEFIAHHKLGVFIALFYLLMALGIGLIVLICRGQRRKPQPGRSHIPPIIFIETPASPPPPPDTFDPFPPPHHYTHYDYEEIDWD